MPISSAIDNNACRKSSRSMGVSLRDVDPGAVSERIAYRVCQRQSGTQAAAYAGMVWNWLRRQTPATRETTLRGAPVKPRLKAYSAETGYVYQYAYQGYRSAQTRDGGQAKEYVFSVSRDRKTYFPVSVSVADAVVKTWSSAHERVLSETELYAIAKLSLFEAFDERNEVQQFSMPIEPDAAAIDRHLSALGRL
jgi:hypothetical protein